MIMKCVISETGIRVFVHAIHALAKLGEELYVEPSKNDVSFRTVNSSRSAYGSFVFSSCFFSSFEADTCEPTNISEAPETVKCKVAMKAFLNAFKSIHYTERNVERCKITLDGSNCKLLMQLWCRYSIVRTYNLSFIECETLKAVFDTSNCLHKVTSQPKLLNDVFNNFQTGQDEVSLAVAETAVTVRNYVDDEPDLSRIIRTEIHLESAELNEYNIGRDCEIVFCLKEAKALLVFAEALLLPVTGLFSQPGSPIILKAQCPPQYECTFVLATLMANGDTQTTAANVIAQHTGTASKVNLGENIKEKLSVDVTKQTEQVKNVAMLADTASEELLGQETTNTKIRPLTASQCTPSLTSRREMSDTSLKKLTKLASALSRAMNNEHDAISCVPNHSGCELLNGKTGDGYLKETLLDRTSIEHNNIVLRNSTYCPDNGIDDCVPRKRLKAHFLLDRVFNATFDPHSLPGAEVVLVPDSDPED